MGILSFDLEYRRAWMFPRNIRNIAPWKIYGILKVLMQCNDDKSDQKTMYRLLAETGIKRQENVRDKNDGGMRTYFAQLEMLGLIYESGESGKYHYTLAGEAIADEDNPLQVLQFQLLRHQYPSAYGLSANVRIDPRMRVKPFLFILKLLHDDRLGRYLTNEDVIAPVIYGHTNDCYEFVLNKIVQGRGHLSGIKGVIDNPSMDMYTRRGKTEKAFDNMKDIANTALNYLEATQLVVKSRDQGHNIYTFNSNYESLYQMALEEENVFIPITSKREEQSFQRSYGRYLKEKDTRNDSNLVAPKESPALQFATYKYIEYLNDHLFDDNSASFVAEMATFGISSKDAVAAVDKLENKKLQLWENAYLEYAFSGGKYSNEFEKATTEIFVSLGFENSEWIGRKKAQQTWRGNFPDVFIQVPGCIECGLADAKATSSYSLGHADMLKMKETYIHTNKEISDESVLGYFLYIAGGFKGDIDKSLQMLEEATGIPVSALDARGMLKLKQKKYRIEVIVELFKSGRFVSSDELELM